jgi:hypothetical protein
LYRAEALWSQIDRKTEHSLLTDLLNLCPDDRETKIELLGSLVRSFEYMQHEWPAGILYGFDGATAEECAEILREIQIAKRLDSEDRYCAFLASFEARVIEYQARLKAY